MMKSINVSTKITLLILLVSVVAVAAISFFSYDFHFKTVEEKNTTSLTVIADNRAAYINSYLDKAAVAIHVLQNSETLKNGGSGSTSGGGMDMMDMMGGGEPTFSDSPVSDTPDSAATTSSAPMSLGDYLSGQKFVLGVDEIIITSTTGAVSASTDPGIK